MSDRPRQGGISPAGTWRAVAALVAGAAGLLLVVTGKVADGTDLRAGRSVGLADLIITTERENTMAQRDLVALRAEVNTLTATQVGERTGVPDPGQVARLSNAVGLEPVTGRGVTVSLDDAPPGAIDQDHPGWPRPTPDDLVVHQQDVESVVNALWMGGATAMTIMDQRVISTSAVRCVGNTLILHGRVFSPPFRISAIGDPASLSAALNASEGLDVYRQYVAAYGLGYSARRVDRLELSGYVGPLELAHAKVSAG